MTRPPVKIVWDATLNGESPRRRVEPSAFSTTRYNALGAAEVDGKEYRVEVFETSAGRMAVVLRHLSPKARGREVAENQLQHVRDAALTAYKELRSADRAKARAAFLASEVPAEQREIHSEMIAARADKEAGLLEGVCVPVTIEEVEAEMASKSAHGLKVYNAQGAALTVRVGGMGTHWLIDEAGAEVDEFIPWEDSSREAVTRYLTETRGFTLATPQRDESQEHAADAALYVTSVVGVLDDKTASVTTAYSAFDLTSKSQAERLARVYGHLVAPPNGRTYGVFAARNGADEITRLEAGGVDVVELLKVADAPAEPPSLEDQFRALLKAGLLNATVREILAEQDRETYAAYIAKANERYASDEIEIDDKPEVSEGDGGCFVAAWLWVSDDEIPTPDDDEEEDESDDD